MANVTIASNASVRSNRWLPYNYKPFTLGRITDGVGSTDGGIYITQTAGDSAVSIKGICIDEHNCGYYYIITIVTHGSTDDFVVEKFSTEDRLIDTIYASALTGNGRYWAANANAITIDLGVVIFMASTSSYDNGDKYKIELPTAEQMRRRRMYHGGYTTYMRLPEEEGVTYSSDIIPTSLLNRNINFIGGMKAPIPNNTDPLKSCNSYINTLGNSALTASIIWNQNPDAEHSSTAGGTVWDWETSETWQFGSQFVFDVDPGNQADMPITGYSPWTDNIPVATATGDPQTQNISISGRAGHAKIRLDYLTGAGSSKTLAHNQWWPITLILG